MELDKILSYLKRTFPTMLIEERTDYFLMPTICHNHNHEMASNKLYLYKNENQENPLFHCYTECNETFNIYQLIQKIEHLEGRECDFKQAYKILNGNDFKGQQKKKEEDLIIKVPAFEHPLTLQLPEYNSSVMEIFDKVGFDHPWHLEGIDLEVLEKYNVRYSKSYEGVIIPHQDWRGRLIGVRIRTYNKEKEANFKYMPILINGIYHRHPLSSNFYGLFQNQRSIRKHKRVYLFEAEKSVLIAESLFKENLSLAVCGKNLSDWQKNMLIHYLQVEELIVCFDKEKDFTAEFGRQKQQFQSLSNFMKVGIMVDTDGVLRDKESPVDRTKEDFHSLKIWYL